MAFGGKDTTQRGKDFAWIVTKALEAIGLLNKGSAETPAAPEPGEADKVQPVSSNALNVTRVGGVTALISGAGLAALTIFNVDKSKDAHAIVVAAYASVGLIVAAALLTVAIIIAADIRARSAIAVATSPVPAPSHDGAGPAPTATPAPADSATEIVIVPGHTLQLAWDGQSWQVL